MLETKQLQYFMAAADSKSFSEAAKILYTTQSNVSKTIASLEKGVGYSLFRREAGGITLTPRGRLLYKQALPILEGLERMEMENIDSDQDVIRIATNPSSWFARHFSEFYQVHEKEQVRYNIHTDSTFHIVQRIRDMEDDIGFVYVFPEELDRFRYDLNRDQMDFEILGETPAMLFLKTEDMVGKTKERNKNWKGQKLIQTEMDQFRRQSDWTIEETGEVVEGLQVAVTTNSDYIMNIMMKENGLANISPRSFTHYAKQDQPGITLSRDEGKIVYGVLSRRDTVIAGILKDLIEDIRQAIHE